MSDSPPSERYDTRYSTPAPELDDHRLQPGSHPRADPIDRQFSMRRSSAVDRSSLLKINNTLRDQGSISRDFEQAVVDDNRSDHEAEGLHDGVRRGSSSPMVARRLHRPSRNKERVIPSRDSSSTRSSSPPNSVDAFADPRRRERANTLESRGPSVVSVSRHRTVSGGTHRNHPAVSGGSVQRTDCQEGNDSSDEDVCFPNLDEPGKTYKIDYEELEEFVALSKIGRFSPPARRQSWTSLNNTTKIFQSFTNSDHHNDVPRIFTQSASSSRGPVELGIESGGSSSSKVDGKTDVAEYELDEKVPPKKIFNPDRFCFFSSEDPGLTHSTELGGLVGGDTTFRDLFEIGPDGGVWWLDVINPTKDELGAICRAFRVHPLTNEDILTQESREKVELFPQYYFVCFRTFNAIEKENDKLLKAVNIYIVVFREGVLSFSFAETRHSSHVRKRMEKLRDYLSLGSDWICYAMIDDIVDSFAPVIREAEQESESIEDQVFTARHEDSALLLRRIGAGRKRVLDMMRLLGGKADVIKGFAKRCNEQYSVTPRGDIGLYLGDIQDHVVTMMSNLGHVEKMLSRSHANYLAQINVENLVSGNHANKVLAKITLIATILVPLNLICGLFGMNVEVPGKNSPGLGWFFGIIGVIAGFVLVSMLIARRMRYI